MEEQRDTHEPMWEAAPPVSGALGMCAVASPEVAEVLDVATGRYVSYADVIGDDHARAVQLRLQLKTDSLRGNPRYRCAMCMTPVYLVMRAEGRKFFLRHTLEDGRCPAVTRGLLSQEEINARKYNGIKESWRHREMKRWIAECLRADPHFADVQEEKRWSGQFSGAWRKPDVRATFRGMPVAFEVQLSTTFINVIAERREFYLREGGLLFWVFAAFDEGPRRLTQDDVFFNNNRNAFVVSGRTREESLATRRFMLECVWAEPTLGGDVTELRRALVPFDELTLQRDKQRAFHFDFDGTKTAMARQVYEAQVARLKPLRAKFEAWYTAYVTTREEDLKTWGQLRRALAEERVALPEYPGVLPKSLFNALYSAKHGRVVGWDYANFIQIAHHMEPGTRKYLQYFRAALKAYDRADLVRAQDQSGKWAGKVSAYREKLRAGDPAYAPDLTHNDLVRLLFPEMFSLDGSLAI